MPDKENKIGASASIVPQLFFDIIAWVMPGAFIIAVFVLTAVGPEKLWGKIAKLEAQAYPPITVVACVALVLSYVVGYVLNSIWDLFRPLFPQDKSKSVELRRMYHDIKLESLDAGNIILKVKARKHMVRVLFVGFVISLCINLWRQHFSDHSRIILDLVLSAGGLATIVAARKCSRDEENLIEDYSECLKRKHVAKSS